MRIICFCLGLLIIILSTVSVFTGAAEFSISIFFQSRLPRLIAVLLSGAGISVCGLVMQKITQNPFVSPETAGTQDSASLGFVLSLLLFPDQPVLIRILWSFLIAMTGSTLFFLLISKVKNRGIIYVPLLGLILGGIINGLTRVVAFEFDLIQVLSLWLFADYSLIITGRYELLFAIIPGVLATYAFAHHITIAGMGEGVAKSLGAEYRRTVILGLIVISITSAQVVVSAGRIPFLGLVCPYIISWKFSDDVKSVLPLTALTGALLLLSSDLVGRLILMPYEIPVGLTMGIAGGIIFLLVLGHRRREGYV